MVINHTFGITMVIEVGKEYANYNILNYAMPFTLNLYVVVETFLLLILVETWIGLVNN